MLMRRLTLGASTEHHDFYITQVWGAYTFNSDDNMANRTFVNIKEREGAIIEPFTASIASAAVAIRSSYTQLGAQVLYGTADELAV